MINQCASCGKADANLKACKACMMVKYCGVDCQVAHRSAHKKACKKRKRAAELIDEKLFAQPPAREECPICMITLPCSDEESFYMACCGKTLCKGCRYCLTREHCPFCNTVSSEGKIKMLTKRVEIFNDPEAMNTLGLCYDKGQNGFPVDQSKAFELYQRASELGCDGADYNLGCSYFNGLGVQANEKKAAHHWQIAAMMGNVHARHNLGCADLGDGNYRRAMRHFMIAAKCGYQKSLDNVKQGFEDGLVTKEDLEKTLRDYQASCHETKNYQRERIAVLEELAQISLIEI
eukprot:scaffold64941_cov77-Cyclotella_meneghiniana.AAC.9